MEMEVIQTHELQIEVSRKRIRNINIAICPPHALVRVSVPKSTPLALVQAFVESKISWIRKQQMRIQRRPKPVLVQFISGEEHFLWGNPMVLSVNEHHEAKKVEQTDSSIQLCVDDISTPIEREKQLIEFYKSELAKAATPLFETWTKKLGVTLKDWRIRRMKTRWGTYSRRTKRVSINVELAKKPLPCLEYLVVHELAHAFIAGHGKKFYAFMDRHLPDWKERRKLLNKKNT